MKKYAFKHYSHNAHAVRSQWELREQTGGSASLSQAHEEYTQDWSGQATICATICLALTGLSMCLHTLRSRKWPAPLTPHCPASPVSQEATLDVLPASPSEKWARKASCFSLLSALKAGGWGTADSVLGAGLWWFFLSSLLSSNYLEKNLHYLSPFFWAQKWLISLILIASFCQYVSSVSSLFREKCKLNVIIILIVCADT